MVKDQFALNFPFICHNAPPSPSPGSLGRSSSDNPRRSHLPPFPPVCSDGLPAMALGRRLESHSKDNDSEKKEKTKSRKPPNTAFRQQRLLAYSPILTPKTVLPIFFAIGIIFGPLGGLLLYASSKVRFPFPPFPTASVGNEARPTTTL